MNGHSEANGKSSRSRTIALLNVPDTVNAARIEKLLQPYGEIVKMNLRPDHAGAVVEFVEERSVAMAEMGLEGYELDGEKIRVGKVPELLKQKPHLKASKLADRLAEKKKEDEQKKDNQAAGPVRLGSGIVSRPVQSNRGGRRGGLGFKRGGIGPSSRAEGKQPAGGKSNDYFKSLISKGKSEVTKKQADEDKMET
jgi:RNA recognition motif-containing protein